jgi:hypothetical protein
VKPQIQVEQAKGEPQVVESTKGKTGLDENLANKAGGQYIKTR